jgi:biopolymer transport protein ExbB/TolQ
VTSIKLVKHGTKHNLKKEKAMNQKELYQQKKQAQLDEWKAEVDKLKAKASGGSADAQLALKKQIKALEGNIEEGKTKLAEIADASEDAWESIKSSFSDATDKFKK